MLSSLSNIHHNFIKVTKCAAFSLPRRGRVVVTSLSFKLCLLRASPSWIPEMVLFPSCLRWLPRQSYSSPLNFAGAYSSQQVKESRDMPNRSTPAQWLPIRHAPSQVRKWDTRINQHFQCWPTPSMMTSSLTTHRHTVGIWYINRTYVWNICLWCEVNSNWWIAEVWTIDPSPNTFIPSLCFSCSLLQEIIQYMCLCPYK